eukprot:7160993-Prorocentrum_lima.AAC.1
MTSSLVGSEMCIRDSASPPWRRCVYVEGPRGHMRLHEDEVLTLVTVLVREELVPDAKEDLRCVPVGDQREAASSTLTSSMPPPRTCKGWARG